MRFAYILFILFTTKSAYAQSDTSLFQFGIPVDSLHLSCNQDTPYFIRTSHADLSFAAKCTIEKSSFFIGYKNEARNVNYYATYDSTFRINGFAYLTKNKAVVDSLKNLTFGYDQGFCIFIVLPNNWRLVFKNDDIKEKENKFFIKKGAMPYMIAKTKTGFFETTLVSSETKKSIHRSTDHPHPFFIEVRK